MEHLVQSISELQYNNAYRNAKTCNTHVLDWLSLPIMTFKNPKCSWFILTKDDIFLITNKYNIPF